MVLIDANVVLRFLLKDYSNQANQAAAIIHDGAAVTADIMAEVVYVLNGLYQIPREKIKDAVSVLLQELHADEKELILYALELFVQKKLDFTDCMLAARAFVQGMEVFSFDKKLMKTIGELQSASSPHNHQKQSEQPVGGDAGGQTADGVAENGLARQIRPL